MEKIIMKFGIRLSLIAITLMALANIFPVKVTGADSIDLEIDAAAVTPWNISGVMPGDGGLKDIELHNAGSVDGDVYVWVTNVVSSEGVNPESETGDLSAPGELGKYLLFSLTSAQLTTNLNMPVAFDNLPHDIYGTSPYFIKIPLAAGATVTASWHWSFSETGTSQNDAQGDALYFDMYYYLTEPQPENVPNPGVGSFIYEGPYEIPTQLEMSVPGMSGVIRLGSLGEFLEPVVITDPVSGNGIEIESGTKITDTFGIPVVRLEMVVYSGRLAASKGQYIIGDSYDIVGYTAYCKVPSLLFSRPVKLRLSYMPERLPEKALTPYIGFCNVNRPWQKLEVLTFGDSPPSITSLITHASIFAVLVETAREQSVQTTAASVISTATTPLETTAGQDTVVPSTTITSPASPELPTATAVIEQAEPGQPVEQGTNVWQQAGLGIAITGLATMSILTLILRRRRKGGLFGSSGRDKTDGSG